MGTFQEVHLTLACRDHHRGYPTPGSHPGTGNLVLVRLSLNYNSVKDISVPANLTRRQYLSFSVNGVSDINVLAGLTRLQEIEFLIGLVTWSGGGLCPMPP